MYYWFRCLSQFSSSLGHDHTRVEFVGAAEVHVDRRVESRGNCDADESVRAWSVEPFVAVLINERHDSGPSVVAEKSRLLPEGGEQCDVPTEAGECVSA